MIENYKSSNGFTAPHPKETATVPTFDMTARRTARMVVPLSPAAIEDALSEITQIKSAHTYKDISPVANHEIVSESKTTLYLKYFFTAALTVFVLGAGAVGGFAIAQFRNLQDKQGIALIPQPALKEARGMPKLALEVFEDPDAFSEITDETMEEDAEVDDDNPTEPRPSRIPNKRPKQENRDEQYQPSDDGQQSPPQEQRERRVRKPKPEDNSNNNRNGQKQTQNAKESVFQKLKRAIEKLGQN